MSDQYLSQLSKLINQYFSLDEIHTLCFDLLLDYDSVPGNAKVAKVRNLIILLGRNGRLPELLALTKAQRPHVNWPPIPPNLKLPETLEGGASPSVTHNYHGDVYNNNLKGEKVAVGPHSSAGDTYNLSGDFRGANLNVKSTLEDVVQTVNNFPADTQQAQTELKQLIVQLNELLQKAPPEQKEAAEETAESTKILVEEAAKEQPNKTRLKIFMDGLKQSANTLATHLPGIVDLATKIVTAVQTIKAAG